MPALNADADKLFVYARYLQTHSDPVDFDDLMRYYRIAAAYGHYKANHNAQLLITQGLVVAPTGKKEAVDLAMQLVHDDIPGGYYDLARYLEVGYGVQQDVGAAMRYFRKAADLGNPDAQAYVAEKLDPVNMAPDIADQMWRCAAEQGLGGAALNLAINLKLDEHYDEAVKLYQLGVKAGDTLSAYALEVAFREPENPKDADKLGVHSDGERSKRYEAIGNFIERNAGRNPKVPDIDKIVPLPPAPLPAWDGTFEWEKERAAAKPPEKPSDDLVNRMAKEKNLDPATGLPLSDTPAKTSETKQQPSTVANQADRLPLGTEWRSPEINVPKTAFGARTSVSDKRQTRSDGLPKAILCRRFRFKHRDSLRSLIAGWGRASRRKTSCGNWCRIPTMSERSQVLGLIAGGGDPFSPWPSPRLALLGSALWAARNLIAIFPIAALVCACSKSGLSPSDHPDAGLLQPNRQFSCTHELSHLPALNADADKLFMYARYLQKHSDPVDFEDIMRYYRIAAAYGHYKANHNAQLLITQGLAYSPTGPREAVDLAMRLVREGVPDGYYDLGHYVEVGYGVQQDKEAAMRYLRKAADLGNPEAQAYVGRLLNPVDIAPEIARKMWRCAAEQGDGDAAMLLGVALSINHQYAEALAAFQLGVQAGGTQSAYRLEQAFKGPTPSDRINYLGLASDPERSQRYRLIGDFIDRNEGRNPKVPDVDKIVPLPPAPLPAWDGTFQWEKEQAAAKPPEKPSDDLVNRMAKDKNLDPATGLPLSDAPAKTSETEQQPAGVASHVDRLPIGTVALTGDKCPEDGVWCANLGNRQTANTQRRFVKGDTLPPVVIQAPRQIAILDRWMGAREQPENVVWQLVSYSDNV